MLICDRHDSYCTGDCLTRCIEHKILVFLLVPHSSHLTQPLDATVFGALKWILSGITAPLFQLGISRIQKIEWLEAYYRELFQLKPSNQVFPVLVYFHSTLTNLSTVFGPYLIYLSLPILQHQFLQHPLLFPRRRLHHFPLKYLQAHPPILLS